MFMFVCHVQLKCISFSSLIHTVGKVKSSHSFKMGNFEQMKKPKTRIEKINTCKRDEDQSREIHQDWSVMAYEKYFTNM